MTGKTVDSAKTKKAEEKNIENARVLIARSTQSGNDPQVRQYAALLLGQLKESEGIDPLIHALRDPDKKVRAQAVKALGEIGNPSVDSLILLLDDTDWKVRYRAAEVLGIIGSTKAVPFLIATLDDPKDHVRYMAAKAIGETGSGKAENALIVRLSDENEFVRRGVVTALGKTGGIAARMALKDSLSREVSEEVRLAIGIALDHLEKAV
jgi:HEAT repeat protein